MLRGLLMTYTLDSIQSPLRLNIHAHTHIHTTTHTHIHTYTRSSTLALAPSLLVQSTCLDLLHLAEEAQLYGLDSSHPTLGNTTGQRWLIQPDYLSYEY